MECGAVTSLEELHRLDEGHRVWPKVGEKEGEGVHHDEEPFAHGHDVGVCRSEDDQNDRHHSKTLQHNSNTQRLGPSFKSDHAAVIDTGDIYEISLVVQLDCNCFMRLQQGPSLYELVH